MGIPGLWKELDEAVAVTSIAKEADNAFRKDKQLYRLGCDAMIWAYHADSSSQHEDERGPNCGLKMIFYRILRFKTAGASLVFVFDGPDKPRWKRGRRIPGTLNNSTKIRAFQHLLETMGVPWLVAAGEAEAELADMNVRGEIDAVLTDDIDTFLFGGRTIIRNTSDDLTGNKRLRKKTTREDNDSDVDEDDADEPSSQVAPPPKNPVFKYDQAAIELHADLSREACLLVALMAGGDYAPDGFKQSGLRTALALAQFGFADSFAEILRSRVALEARRESLKAWKETVAAALESNAVGLGRQMKKLASSIRSSGDAWPDLRAGDDYLHPRTSNRTPIDWHLDIDVHALVALCSSSFGWSVNDIKSTFQNRLYAALLVQQLRRDALKMPSPATVATSRRTMLPPANKLLVAIHDEKTSSSTDNRPSVRVEVDPSAFLRAYVEALPDPDPHPNVAIELLDENGLFNGLVPSGRHRVAGKPETRFWMPTALVEAACPERLAEFRKAQAEKRSRARSKSRALTATPSSTRSSPVKDRILHKQTLLSPVKTPTAARKDPAWQSSPFRASTPDLSRRQLWPSSSAPPGRLGQPSKPPARKQPVHKPATTPDVAPPAKRVRLSPDSQYLANLERFDSDSEDGSSTAMEDNSTGVRPSSRRQNGMKSGASRASDRRDRPQPSSRAPSKTLSKAPKQTKVSKSSEGTAIPEILLLSSDSE